MRGGACGLGGGGGLAFGADRIHRFQIDDVAKENFSLVEFVAPDGQRLEGQRAFAQRADHQLASRLDALGDGDFALARQKLDRAHLAQVHANRIVGAIILFGGGAGLGDDFLAAFDHGGKIGVGAFFLFLALDDVDAHLVEQGHRVFDLLRGDLVGGQDLVQLVIGHIAAGLGLGDHLANADVGHVQQRRVGIARRVLAGLGALGGGLGLDLAVGLGGRDDLLKVWFTCRMRKSWRRPSEPLSVRAWLWHWPGFWRPV